MPLKRILGPLSTAMVTVLVGLLIAVQFRTQIEIKSTPAPIGRIEDLTKVLTETERARAQLQTEVADLRRRISESTAETPSGQISALAEENRELRQFAGLTAVSGTGVVVTVTAISTPQHPNNTVFSKDLLSVVNELWAGGAEAVSINDQRLVVNSEIREAGSYMLVNMTRIMPPYVIKAIGDGDMLEKTLLMRGGVADSLSTYNVVVKPTKQAQVKIPAWDGALKPRYAHPDTTTP